MVSNSTEITINQHGRTANPAVINPISTEQPYPETARTAEWSIYQRIQFQVK